MRYFSLAIAIALTGCKSHAGNDWQKICDTAKAVKASGGSSADMGRKFDQELGKSDLSPNVQRAIQDLRLVGPSSRYPVLQQIARESGQSDWQCAEAESLLNSQR